MSSLLSSKEVTVKVRAVLILILCLHSLTLAQWQPTNAYSAQTTHALGWDGEYLFTSTFWSVFVSSNLGVRWEKANTGLGTRPFITAFHLIKPGTTSIMLCAKDNEAVYRTTNHGATWSLSNTGLPSGTAPIAFVQFGTTTLASLQNDVYRSTDNGVTWNDATSDPDAAGIVKFCVSGSTIFGARSWNGLVKSTDGGTVWDTVRLRTDMHYVSAIASNGSNVYVPTLGFTSPAMFFRSTNGGITWSTGSPDFGGLVYDIVAIPSLTGNDILLVGNDLRATRSTDGGTSWQDHSLGLPSFAGLPRLVSVTSGVNRFVFGGTFSPALFPTKNGVFRTSIDGHEWSGTNAGLSHFSVRALFANNAVILGGTQWFDMMRSSNGGAYWDLVRTGYGNDDVNMFERGFGALYCGTSRGVSVSYDDGATWPSGPLSGNVFAIAFLGQSAFVSTQTAFYRSTDNGATWSVIPGFSAQTILSIHTNPTLLGSSRILAGTSGAGVFVSSIGGATWSASNSGLPANVSVSAFATMTTGGTTVVFAGTSQGVYRSTNGGANWTAANTGLGAIDVRAFAVSGANLFAGTIHGIFLSLNLGGSWNGVSTGLSDLSIRSLLVYQTKLYAGTDESGLWERPLLEMILTSTPETHEKPMRFALEQNYPNPFNPTTEIRYQTSEVSHVTLNVFDMLGRKVATLVDEIQDAGFKSVEFDAGGLASGVYFYRLTAGNFVATKKLMMIR